MKYEIRETLTFRKWFSKVGRETRKQILVRLARAENGNLGDHSSVGSGISELRFRSGRGLRIYYTVQGETIILLLGGGDKSSQDKDIKKVKKLIADLRG